MKADDIDSLLSRHVAESTGTLRDCSVSELTRGECTSRPYFIFKIDLSNSTAILRTQRPAVYAKIAHAYLSTVDVITQHFGAEPEQTEYHGDSVLAMFPERGNTAIEVVSAAVQAHYAVNKLRKLVGIALHPKVLLHYAPLTVAKIGPWSESHRVAIGLPIHTVAKREKELPAGCIWLSDQLAAKLTFKFHQQLLDRSYKVVTESEEVPVPPAPPSDAWTEAMRNPSVGLLSSLDAFSLFSAGAVPPLPASNLLSGIYGTPDPFAGRAAHSAMSLGNLLAPATEHPQRFETRWVEKKRPDGYLLRIATAYGQLDLPITVLSGT